MDTIDLSKVLDGKIIYCNIVRQYEIFYKKTVPILECETEAALLKLEFLISKEY